MATKSVDSSPDCWVCGAKTKVNLQLGDRGDILQFVLTTLFEAEATLGQISDSGEKISLCGKCLEEGKKAMGLYGELRRIVQEIRKIQKRLVEEVKRRPGGDGELRKFVRESHYDYGGTFVVFPEGFMESEEVEAVGGSQVKIEVTSENEEDASFAEVPSEDDAAVDMTSEEDANWSDGDNSDDNYSSDDQSNSSDDDLKVGNPKRKYKLRQSPRRKRRRIDDKASEMTLSNNSSCELCGDNLDPSEILPHVRNHVGDDYLRKCPNDQCPLAFSHMYALRRHLNLRKTCRKELSSVSPSSSSFLRMNRREKFICEVCGVLGNSFEGLQAHLYKKHEKEFPKIFLCPMSTCSKMFAVRHSVEVHLLLEHDLIHKSRQIQWQTCFDCYQKFKLHDLEEHLSIEHGAKKIIKCSQCPYLFSAWEQYFDHLFFSHRHSGIPLTCDICHENTTFSDHLEMRKHYFEHHQIGKQYICDLCADEPQKKESVHWTLALLNRHKSKVHKRLTCDLCQSQNPSNTPQQTFGCADTLHTHKVKVHGWQPLKCNLCSESLPNKKRLQKHIKEKHTMKDKGPFRCNELGCDGTKEYSTLNNLQCHQRRMHRNEGGAAVFKHLCNDCGKRFGTPSKLKLHQDAVHLKLKPFVCDLCGEGYSTKHALKRHVENFHEAAERLSHVCEECGGQYKTEIGFRNHLKLHRERGDGFKGRQSKKVGKGRIGEVVKVKHEQLNT